MGLAVTSVNDLSPSLVTQVQAELSQLMQESYPEVSLTRGAVHDLLCYFGAVFGAWNRTEINRYLAARSLAAIQADPTLSDPTLVDDLLSNYRVTRKPGGYARGEVVIVISNNAITSVPAGFVFSASGLLFQTTDLFTAVPAGSPLMTDTTRVINPLGDGTYAFTVSAACTQTGAVGNISRNTRFTAPTVLNNYVTAYAANDFDGGVDVEDNAALLRRLQDGIAAKTLSGSANIRALIKTNPSFINTLDYSVIGFGNPEMTRDQHTIFPGSFGGRVDVYARTRALPVSTALTKSATLVDTNATGGIWQFALLRDDVPGFYELDQIRRPGDPLDWSGYEILLDRRQIDSSPGASLVPDIATVEEGVYSRYQTSVIRFADGVASSRNLPLGTQEDFIVSVAGMPQIAEIQDFLGGPEVRYRAGDLLVRAAVPCFLSVNFEIRQARGLQTPDLAAIKNDICAVVNNMGFVGQLHASVIADVAHAHLLSRQALGPIDMQGRIRRPSGEMHWLRDRTILQVPNDPGNYVTGNTVVFILDPNNIGISVVTEGYTEEV